MPQRTLVRSKTTEQAHTVESFAATIQYHPESVRRAIRQGRIRALRFGQGWRIPQAEVNRILTQGLPCPREDSVIATTAAPEA